MLKTYLEVLVEVKSRYESATQLSWTYEGGRIDRYAHHVVDGSVGDSIGCLFTEEQARRMDNAGKDKGIESIYNIPEFRDIIDGVIDANSVGLGNLRRLQHMHDNASDVVCFRLELDREISRPTGAEGSAR